MRVIVFSKDRPLQLEGYLASLLHYSGLPQSAVTVLFVEDPSYAPLAAQYPGVHWLAESGGFHATLEKWLAELPDAEPVFFGCDDVVFFNRFDPAQMAAYLHEHPECAGFTVRSGSNSQGAGAVIPPGTPAGAVVVWDAAPEPPAGLQDARHFFGYPFEVMGTAYRAGLVRRMFAWMAAHGLRYRGPNDFEGAGMRMLRRKRVGLWRRLVRRLSGKGPVAGDGARLLPEAKLAMFNAPSCCAAQDVNRVQDLAKNLIQGGMAEDAGELKRKFMAGWRMEWRHMDGLLPPSAFIGMTQWRLSPPAP